MIQRALISVSDKTGIPEIARRLQKKSIQIISTGGTAMLLKGEGIAVTSVEDVTKFPECFSGRVKTLHPLVLGGLLFRRADQGDQNEARKLDIQPIDLVIVNLYPFEKGLKSAESGCQGGVCVPSNPAAREQLDKDLIELIDIGGPTLLRAAAKNFESVTVVCDPGDYERVLSAIEEDGDTTLELRKELAAKVFLRTAAYDAIVTEYLSGGENAGVILTQGRNLRYGENPHQWGRVYTSAFPPGLGLGVANVEVLQGKGMSYLNYLDADAAWQCALEFEEPTAVFLKHASPCGVASDANILEAFRRGYNSDPRSAFGVIIALNRECSQEIVQEVIDRKIFVELLVAPRVTEQALKLLRQKPNIRVLQCHSLPPPPHSLPPEYRSISGGVLVQSPDRKVLTERDLTVVTKKKPSKEQMVDLLFAFKVVKHVKSNAIVLAKGRVTVGIGPGQTSRVDAVEIAVKKASASAKASTFALRATVDRSADLRGAAPKQTPAATLQGTVMASDAFFPFPDSVEEAAEHGISAIIQPGGSIHDAEVIAKAEELGIAMVTTGVRAFRH